MDGRHGSRALLPLAPGVLRVFRVGPVSSDGRNPRAGDSPVCGRLGFGVGPCELAETLTSPFTERIRPETAWVLARAFLPPDFELEPPSDPAAVLAEAHRLRMAPRIGSRCTAAQLALEPGRDLGAAFQDASRRVALDALRVEAMVRLLAKAAKGTRAELVLLKALHSTLLAFLVPVLAHSPTATFCSTNGLP